MPWHIIESDGKYCVAKEDSDTPIKGGCHAERGDALKHLRALYAAEPNMMKYNVIALTEDLLLDTDEDNVKWIKAWRYSTWDHPRYGNVTITPETGQNFKAHFDDGTLGREHLVNYDHGVDAAKGGKAAGVILDIDPREDGIYYKCKFTDTALQEIYAGEWRYVSPEYDDWVNPENGELFEDMPFDLAITNTPFFKGLPPLNFSEVYETKESKIPPTKIPKGGRAVDELLKQFAERLGVDISEGMDEATILSKADDLNSAIEPLRRAKEDGERTRTFREAFPEEFKAMEKLKKSQVEGEARNFAEGYRRFTIKAGESEYKSTFGFSEIVIDEISEVYKKFADRAASPADMKKLLDLIGDKGIVDYSETGSSRQLGDREWSEDPKIAFSEAVQSTMEQDNLDYEQAMNVAKAKHPDLYESYLKAIPQR